MTQAWIVDFASSAIEALIAGAVVVWIAGGPTWAGVSVAIIVYILRPMRAQERERAK